MKTWTPDDSGGNFELTPMIDVVFLLIAFFMTLASFITNELIKIEIPIAETATVPEEKRDRQYLTVTSQGDFYFGAQRVTPELMTDLLAKAKNANPDLRVYFRADADAMHEDVNTILESCAKAGIFDVIFATNQS